MARGGSVSQSPRRADRYGVSRFMPRPPTAQPYLIVAKEVNGPRGRSSSRLTSP